MLWAGVDLRPLLTTCVRGRLGLINYTGPEKYNLRCLKEKAAALDKTP